MSSSPHVHFMIETPEQARRARVKRNRRRVATGFALFALALAPTPIHEFSIWDTNGDGASHAPAVVHIVACKVVGC